VLMLAATGYVGASHPWLMALAAGCVAMGIWAVLAFRQPRAAVIASFTMLLVAGTKFRSRDATDSLAGIVDSQIVLELGLYALVAIAVVAAAACGRCRRVRAGAAEALIVGYAALALISTIWSQAPALTLVRALQLSIISALAIIAVRVMAPSRAMWMSCSALSTYVLACAMATSIFTAEATVDPDGGAYRFAWFAVHPIAVGTLAAIAGLAMLSPSVFSRAGADRVCGLPRPLVLLALVAILILTSTRGPLLAFIAGAGMLMIARMSPPARLRLVAIASAAVLVCAVGGADLRRWLAAAADGDSFISRTFFRGQSVETLLSLNGRLELWSDLRPVIASNPIAGLGFQASRSVVLETAPWAAYAHNALLQATLDLGLAGALIVAGLVAAGFGAAFRSAINPWLRAVVLALMTFLTLNSVSTESFAGSPGFETLLLFLCVLCAAPRRQVQTEPA
jgi:exopolysaccharide production protein ExoQ